MCHVPRLLGLAAVLSLAPLADSQCHEVKTPGSLGPGALFGQSVSLSDDVLLVGAPGADAVVFHEWTGSDWNPIATFTGPTGSNYGSAVSVSGDLALVGAPLFDDAGGGTTDSGSVQLFIQGPPGTWTPAPLLGPPNPQNSGHYGWSVDTDGTRLLVGAPGQNADRGNVRLYEVVAGQLQQTQNITAVVAQVGQTSRWGHDVAVDGDGLVIGAPRADVGGFSENGVAYFYRRQGASYFANQFWTFNGNFVRTGVAVDVDGDRGVTQAENNVGSVLWTRWDGASYALDDTTISVGSDAAIAMSGNRTMQGLPEWTTSLVGPAEGGFRFHTTSTPGLWSSVQLIESLVDPTEGLGTAVAIDGDRAVVTEPLDDTGGLAAGAVFTYDVSLIAWNNTFEFPSTAISGVTGEPVMAVDGSFCDGDLLEVELSNSAPSSSAALVVGLSFLGVPFKGGVLGPNPDVILDGFFVNALGNLRIAATVPAGLPQGLDVYLQWFVVDPVAIKGLAASRTWHSITPVPAP